MLYLFAATNKIHTQTTAAGLNTNQPPPNADTLRGNLLQWLAVRIVVLCWLQRLVVI